MNSNYRIAELLLRLQAGETLDANELEKVTKRLFASLALNQTKRTGARNLRDFRVSVLS
ncbi:hypothetical protein [Lacticaseibacillus suibinensis]|uniref:hypothetical protein n=1 Tax=Lacticaseibacillus suibinensis TaxID=2486011 RepID=UPI0013DE2E70|nr:hypothetical protein [Lacticaseibacillus suibinensis]